MNKQVVELNSIKISDALQSFLDGIVVRPNIAIIGGCGNGKSQLMEGLRRAKRYSWCDYRFVDEVNSQLDIDYICKSIKAGNLVVFADTSTTVETLKLRYSNTTNNLLVIVLNFDREISEMKYFDKDGDLYAVTFDGGYPIKGLSKLDFTNHVSNKRYKLVMN